MDRLPRDVAGERMHHDIVRLLDEHHAPAGVQGARASGMTVAGAGGHTLIAHFAGSPNHHQMITHPTVIGAAGVQGSNKSRSKKRANGKNNNANSGQNPHSPSNDNGEGNNSLRRKPSTKKSNQQRKTTTSNANSTTLDSITNSTGNAGSNAMSLVDGLTLSPHPDLVSPYDLGQIPGNGSVYSNMGHLINGKQPPSYEDCIKGTQSLHSLHAANLTSLEYAYALQQQQQQHQNPYPNTELLLSSSGLLISQAGNTQSGISLLHPNGALVGGGVGGVGNGAPPTLSPPYSNQSPPHSVQSNMSMSPQAYIGKYYYLF